MGKILKIKNMTQNTLKLLWTSKNCPSNGNEHYWELGTTFDFHVDPESTVRKHSLSQFLGSHDVEHKTRLIVTDIKDSGEENSPRLQIVAHVTSKGSVQGEPIEFAYGSALCADAYWLGKVDGYMVMITNVADPKIIHADKEGNVLELS